MSYQVLARKWRPKYFAELVGQEHVVRALSHALDTQRMHHAYLFTGTRGVGKTTIARIFAKSLNCVHGPSSKPCGDCAACRDIDAGRFMDLLEIDAASNTGVDDVRELIESAQYTPARGRFKVYLIDEVHMLSKSAFNALLKTLEEPPEHVKFLLATTDPQKLPMTVLSRCLKFNLKRLLPEQIAAQMRRILDAEGIAQEAAAIEELARAADGSLRDGLSLLDQAIAHGGGAVRAAEVRAMLGTIEHSRVLALLQAIQNGDGKGLLEEVERVAEFAPDFAGVLDALAGLLHRVQLHQLVPGVAGDDASIAALAASLPAEEVQLYYQIAITGRRDLPLAPSPRIGFEMTLLRMLAFRPAETGANLAADRGSGASDVAATLPTLRSGSVAQVADPRAEQGPAASPLDWPAWIEAAGLRGPVGQLARHSALLGIEGDVVRLVLKAGYEHLSAPPLLAQLQEKLSATLRRPITLRYEKPTQTVDTPVDAVLRERAARQQAAERALDADPLVQALVRDFDARVVPGSVRPSEG
jgi:DNA polymerase-3 subunit gamma/tau